tara:strand:+ start:1090 stop:2343 length:1254 start_codon:yes stop_codon:yes gene_type:complete
MSDVQRSGWADNPFTFSITHGIEPAEPQPFGMSNFLKDFFEKLKAKYVRVPPSQIESEEDIGSEGWRPELGMTGAKYDSFAPDPGFIPITQRRKPLVTHKGVKGFNTHYNIMGDQSSSMSAKATEFEGKLCNRSIVLRLAASCLIKQASFNMDSFTMYSYNDSGKVLWNLTGEPAYNYEDCIAWLTSDSISKVWNIVENNKGSSTTAWNEGSQNTMINCLAPYVPDGFTDDNSGFDIMIKNSQKHDIQGMITVFLTDGDGLADTSKRYWSQTAKQRNECKEGPDAKGSWQGGTGAFNPDNVTEEGKKMIGNKSYDQWLRQFGHVFYIIIRSEDEQKTIRENVEAIEGHLMGLYGWDREEASKFIWGFPDVGMKDSSGRPITDVAEQMAWLFAEIGRIGAGLSEEFNDLATPLDEDED